MLIIIGTPSKPTTLDSSRAVILTPGDPTIARATTHSRRLYSVKVECEYD
jgi:hypothetical protein